MGGLNELQTANLGTINIQALFSNFWGTTSESLLHNVIAYARQVEVILRKKNLFDNDLEQKLSALERGPQEFATIKMRALKFATSCQAIIEQEMGVNQSQG